MNILVIGCGRVGMHLAQQLSENGHDVSVIDANPELLEHLGPDFQGMAIAGIAMDLTVLKEAGIEGCDAIAVVSQDDNLNITVAQIAKQFFGVQRIITRVSDPMREDVFEHFGLNTVCPTKIAAETIYSALVDDVREQIISFDTSTVSASVQEIQVRYLGWELRDIPLQEGECVFGVQHEDARITLYDGRQHITLQKGDRLLINRIVD